MAASAATAAEILLQLMLLLLLLLTMMTMMMMMMMKKKKMMMMMMKKKKMMMKIMLDWLCRRSDSLQDEAIAYDAMDKPETRAMEVQPDLRSLEPRNDPRAFMYVFLSFFDLMPSH